MMNSRKSAHPGTMSSRDRAGLARGGESDQIKSRRSEGIKVSEVLANIGVERKDPMLCFETLQLWFSNNTSLFATTGYFGKVGRLKFAETLSTISFVHSILFVQFWIVCS